MQIEGELNKEEKKKLGLGFIRFYDLGNLNGFQLKHWELDINSIKNEKKIFFREILVHNGNITHFMQILTILTTSSDKGEKRGAFSP